jgi:hypothetical protein
MASIPLWAQPWWVNLLVLVPLLAFFLLRRKGLLLSKQQLLWLTLFGMSFGFVEASVVVYLRAAIGMLPGWHGTLEDLRRSSLNYQQLSSLSAIPPGLFTIEVYREAATMVMLVALAWVGASQAKERWAVFLWTFAVWDIAYYAGLWFTVRWPASLHDVDILFLIPDPWVAQVWFPVTISLLTMAAIGAAARPQR